MINRDYRTKRRSRQEELPRLQQLNYFIPQSRLAQMALFTGFFLVFISITLTQKTPTPEPTGLQPYRSGIQLDIGSNLGTDDTSAPKETEHGPQITEQKPEKATKMAIDKVAVKVKKGDSLSRIFARTGLGSSTLHQIMSLGESTAALKRIHPGDSLYYATDDESGQLLLLEYPINRLDTLQVRWQSDRFEAHTISKEMEIRHGFGAASITSSLFNAGKAAGLSDRLIMELGGIFQWDIDFILDIRKNDRFSVIYEKKYIEGEKAGVGNIIAASFTNQGKTFTAVRYTDKRGKTSYYSPDGRSMRKAFLRAPLNFTRISGSFSLRRKHPILNRIRAHRGVDYAAPKGTPVRASGDGKVKFVGRQGGFGKIIILNHGQTYQSRYAHLSRFAKGMRSGARVKQGQIIGFVGATGLATGNHLHYEFLVNGVHRNPRTISLPNANPIAQSELDQFKSSARKLVAQLGTRERIYLAQLELEEQEQ